MVENVAILGASPDSHRYSNMAQKALSEKGFQPIPVNPNYVQIDGVTCYRDLVSCDRKIDTVTVYVNPGILETKIEDILAVTPRRVILNPGTESPAVEERLVSAGINVQKACTLVLLNSGRF